MNDDSRVWWRYFGSLAGTMAVLLVAPAWGQQGASDPERAVEALAASLRLQGENPDSLRTLRQALAGGWPKAITSRTLDVIQERIYQTSWQRKEFEINPGKQRAFFTSGLLFPPQVPMRDPLRSRLPPENLPASFRFNRICYAYLHDEAEQTWRLKFRVYYVSPSLIEHDLAPVVEQLAEAFLRVYAVTKQNLGMETRYSPDGVVDLWVTDAGPPRIEQSAQAPGHLFFYASNQMRSALEWIREVAHEYGHLVFPPLDGFLQAEEAHMTGRLGESVLLRLLASTPGPYGFELPMTDLAAVILGPQAALVEGYNRAGPDSPLIDQTTEAAMNYAVGRVMYLFERHGAEAVKDILSRLPSRPTLRLRDLVNSHEEWTRGRKEFRLSWNRSLREGEQITDWVFAQSNRITLRAAVNSPSSCAITLKLSDGQFFLGPQGLVVEGGAEVKEATLPVVVPRPGWYQVTLTVKAAPRLLRVESLTVFPTP